MKIIDDEEYEKNKNFFLELGEPRMVDMSLQKGAVPNLPSFSVLSMWELLTPSGGRVDCTLSSCLV